MTRSGSTSRPGSGARPLRIVCYAVNGSGLGHVTRLIAIARWLRRLETLASGTAPEILFLTSTEATSLLSDARFAAFKLPSKGVARSAGLDVLEHRRLAKHFVWQTLATMAPDLLVVDTFPQGSFDELLPVLDGPFKKVLVLRDVKPEFGARPIFQAALRLYDQVIVPHAREHAPDVAKVLSAGQAAAWVGDVMSVDAMSGDAATVAALRSELGVARGHKLVYVSAGGGGDPGSEAALQALVEALRDRTDVHLLVGAGPLYRGQRLSGGRLTWFTEAGVARYFPVLDAALTAGGYNTVHELLHLGVPSAFFAQDKIADQQADRIARIVARGAALQLSSLAATLVGEVLDALILGAQSFSAAARALVPDNGARLAAANALSLIAGRERDALLGAAELLSPRLAALIEAAPEGSELLACLGQLDPSPGLSALGAHATLEPLLPQLSAEARAEVVAALGTRSGSEGRHAVEAAFVALLRTANTHGTGALLPGLIEAALKKHPRAQEADASVTRWAVGILSELAPIVTPAAPLSTHDRALLYRVFPRLADVPLREAFAAFHGVLAASADASVDGLQRRLQALKLQRRVTLQSLAGLLTPRTQELEA